MHDKLVQFITLFFETSDEHFIDRDGIENLALALEKNFEIKEKENAP